MNSSHSAERPLANMVAAVSQEQDSLSSFVTSAPSPPSFLEPALCDPFRRDAQNVPLRARASEPSAYASSHHPPTHPPFISAGGFVDHPRSPNPPRSYSLPTRRRSLSRGPAMLPDFGLRMITPADAVDNRDELRPSVTSSTTLTESQNHHMRSSPPIQPGEQNFPGKLPSFSEFLHTTRTTTPPRTPQRRNDSVESSPHVQPQFDDVAWSDSKRRRVDTLGDIYEPPVVQVRRTSSAIDPALAGYSPHILQQHPVQPVGSGMHHRQSHSYVPPQQQSMPSNPHMRHQSPSAPQGHISYAQPIGQSPFQQSMVQQGSMYEPRHSYYHESPAAVYGGYDRPNDSYFTRAGYQGYDTSYSDIRFQQHVGLDHNAFNRKRRGNLPKEATNLLKDWFAANRTSPYPTEDQKMELCNRTGLSLNQVSNWFINARRRAPQKEQREREANGPET